MPPSACSIPEQSSDTSATSEPPGSDGSRSERISSPSELPIEMDSSWRTASHCPSLRLSLPAAKPDGGARRRAGATGSLDGRGERRGPGSGRAGRLGERDALAADLEDD